MYVYVPRPYYNTTGAPICFLSTKLLSASTTPLTPCVCIITHIIYAHHTRGIQRAVANKTMYRWYGRDDITVYVREQLPKTFKHLCRRRRARLSPYGEVRFGKQTTCLLFRSCGVKNTESNISVLSDFIGRSSRLGNNTHSSRLVVRVLARRNIIIYVCICRIASRWYLLRVRVCRTAVRNIRRDGDDKKRRFSRGKGGGRAEYYTTVSTRRRNVCWEFSLRTRRRRSIKGRHGCGPNNVVGQFS